MSQRVSPAAINALKEALCSVYWYKKDLRSFLSNALPDVSLLGRLNWDDYKRNIATSLVETLARTDGHQHLLVLVEEVCRIEDFSHLEQVEDGKQKAAAASKAVASLRKLWLNHSDVMASRERTEAARVASGARLRKNDEVSTRLADLNKRFMALVTSTDPHRRGYDLESLLRDLFDLFDLDPKASFKVEGDQVDGAFVFESMDYLLEARWRAAAADANDLDGLAGKLQRRLDNTLGLFISMNGFTEGAITAHTGMGRRTIILMAGSDLVAVLEGHLTLPTLLGRKRRHAAHTGEIFLPAADILRS